GAEHVVDVGTELLGVSAHGGEDAQLALVVDQDVGVEPGADGQRLAGPAGGAGDVLQPLGHRAGADAQGQGAVLGGAAGRQAGAVHRPGAVPGQAGEVGAGADQGDPGAG